MTQTWAPPRAAAVPDAVARLAADRGLGMSRKSYQPRHLTWALVVVLIVVGLGTAVIGVGLVVLWAAVRTPNLNRRRAAMRVHLYDNGIIHADGDSLEVYRWHDIDRVFQKIVEQRSYGIKVSTQYLFTVIRKDGRTLRLTGFYDDVEELGRHVNRHASGAWLPAARQAVRDGNAVRFGGAQVTREGFRAGNRVAPWSEIRDATVSGGVVRVVLTGKFLAFWSRPVARVPNLPLLVSLVRELRPAGPA